MRTRKFFRKIHRWIGITAALWLLLLASTGLLLQHSHDWGLDSKFIHNQTLLKHYGVGKQYLAFGDKHQQLLQIDQQIFINETVSIRIDKSIVAALYQPPNWILATATDMLWLDNKGQLIQQYDSYDGIKTPIQKLGLLEGELYYQTPRGLYNLNESTISKSTKANIIWSKENSNPSIKQKAITLSSKDYLSYEKFIFDIHAGITTASILNDIAAITLIMLSLSGILLFFRKSKNNRSK
jgi:hypothetical protein